jgi:hypothetical protein
MAKVVTESQRDWQDRLPMIVAAYNATYHETTGHSPYYLVFGCEYRIPLDLILSTGGTDRVEDRQEYANQLRERIEDAYKLVNERLKTTTERMKQRYDMKVKPIQFEIGQLALYYCPRKQVRRSQKWRRMQQLCIIVKKLNDVLYCVKLGPKAKSIVVHVDRLCKFSGDPPPKWVQRIPRQSADESGCCSGGNNIGSTDASTVTTRVDCGKPAYCTGCTETTGSPLTEDASSTAAQPQGITLHESGSPIIRRPQRTRRRPFRYRDDSYRQIQTGPSLNNQAVNERSYVTICRRKSTLSMDAAAGSSTSHKVGKLKKTVRKGKGEEAQS